MNAQSRESDFAMDSTASSSKGGKAALPKSLGLNDTEAVQQLTPGEVEALVKARRIVNMTKGGGLITGTALSWFVLGRREKQMGVFKRLFLSSFGGLGFAVMIAPLGMMGVKAAFDRVEDPKHLRQVLASAMAEKAAQFRSLGAPASSAQKGRPGQPKSQQGQEEASATDWGGASSSPDRLSSFESSDQPSTSQNTNRGPDDLQTMNEMPAGTGPGSRWAQLRGERGVEPSKWERIRQDSAREAHNNKSQQTNPAQASDYTDRAQQSPYARSSGPSRSETTAFSGAVDDPRWSSPAAFSQQTSGWGDSEFIEDTAPGQQRGEPRKYGVLSVLEDERQSGRLQGFQIESDAPIQVVKGSLLAALSGGISGSVYGVLKGKEGAGTYIGSRMALQFFAFGFPFFAVREYIVSPVLNRSSSGPDPENRHMRLTSVPNKHTDKILASGISGAVAGAGLAAYARGVSSIHKGAMTFGFLCMALQFVGNEARVARNSILRPMRPQSNSPVTVAEPNHMDVAASLNHNVDQRPLSSESGADVVKPKEKEQSSFLNSLQKFLPVTKISDEDYEKTLSDRLQTLHQRIADVEAEILDIEKQEHDRSSSTVSSN